MSTNTPKSFKESLNEILGINPDTHVPDEGCCEKCDRRDAIIELVERDIIGEDDKPNIGDHDNNEYEWCTNCDSLTYEGEDGSSWCLCHQKNKWRNEQRKALKS